MAKRVLDCGVLGVIFPFTSTPELARQAAAACRYPPQGLRGSGADLAQFRWPAPEGYYDFADESVLVVAVVENTLGLSHIDEIAAVPGIDVLFIGTSDLSFSLGLRGRQDHPRLERAIASIVAAGKRHGKVLGRPGLGPDQIKRFQDQGFQFFMSGTDTAFMAAGAAQLLKPLGKKPSLAWGGGIKRKTVFFFTRVSRSARVPALASATPIRVAVITTGMKRPQSILLKYKG
jgi:2-keto-3-deoxy-L-rhamnonate aldolase RhmA